MRALLSGSALLAEFGSERELQDPLSFRCAPQVHGAADTALESIWTSWELALNHPVDNPLVDLDEGRLISHGNTDTTLLCLGLDSLRLALAKALEICGYRLHKLSTPAFSGLPSGLSADESATGGVDFVVLGYLAEARAQFARAAAAPVLLTPRGGLADGVEDHASPLPLAVHQLERQLDAAWTVVTVETVIASWAIARRGIPPARLGQGLRQIVGEIIDDLPLGREGESQLDLRPIAGRLRRRFEEMACPGRGGAHVV